MNLRVSFFLSFLLIGLFTSAQEIKTSEDFDVQLSKPYRVIDAYEKRYESSDEYVVALKITKTVVNVQSFDIETLTQKGSNEYKDFSRDTEFEYFTELSGKFYLIYSSYDRRADKEQLFRREIDPKTAKFKNSGELLIEVNGKIAGDLYSGPWYNYKTTNKYRIERSREKEKLLVLYRLSPEKRADNKNYDNIGLHVFDSNLSQQWEKVIEMPHTEKKMDYFDRSVNADGDVYILAKVYNDETTDDMKSKRSEDPNYHMELFLVKAGGADIKKEKIIIEGKFINSLMLYEATKDFMVIGGYYQDPGTKYGVSGVYLIKVKKDGELYDQYYHEIPLEILNQNVRKVEARKNSRDEEKGKSSFKNLLLKRIVTAEDGSVVLIGEQYELEIRTSTSANGSVYTYITHHYDNILITRIGVDGKLNWMHKIPKEQKGKSKPGGMSFQYMNNGDSHYLLYLDNIKNLNLEKDEDPALHLNGSGGYLTSAKIEHGSGISSKHSLFDVRDVKGIEADQFETNRIVQLSDNEIAVEVYKKKKEDIWIRVKLK